MMNVKRIPAVLVLLIAVASMFASTAIAAPGESSPICSCSIGNCAGQCCCSASGSCPCKCECVGGHAVCGCGSASQF